MVYKSPKVLIECLAFLLRILEVMSLILVLKAGFHGFPQYFKASDGLVACISMLIQLFVVHLIKNSAYRRCIS